MNYFLLQLSDYFQELQQINSAVANSEEVKRIQEESLQIVEYRKKLRQTELMLQSEIIEHSQTKAQLEETTQQLQQSQREVRGITIQQTHLETIQKIIGSGDPSNIIADVSKIYSIAERATVIKNDMKSLEEKLTKASLDNTKLNTRIIENESKMKLLKKENEVLQLQLSNSTVPSDIVSLMTIVDLLSRITNDMRLSNKLRDAAKVLCDQFKSGEMTDLAAFVNVLASECHNGVDGDIIQSKINCITQN